LLHNCSFAKRSISVAHMDIGSYMVHLAELPIDQKITREKEKA